MLQQNNFDNKSNSNSNVPWCVWVCVLLVSQKIFNFGKRNRMKYNLIIDLSLDLISI